MEIKSLTPALGAVVERVDTRLPLSGEEISRIRGWLMEYKVLFFRRQNLDYEEHERLAHYFGEPLCEPFVKNIPGHPGLSHVDRTPFFHSDLMQMEDPPLFSMLQMKSVPEVGGDTMFADLVTSYEALSEPMRRFLEELTGLYASRGYDFTTGGAEYAKQRAAKTGGNVEEILAAVQPHDHPLVRYIPETGRNNYWVSEAFTRSVNGLTEEESTALLVFLFRHQLDPKYVIRWHWEAGDIAFWDHRTTLHSGVADYGSSARNGVRATIAGGRPIPARACSN
jgi:taurine dioxygenase